MQNRGNCEEETTHLNRRNAIHKKCRDCAGGQCKEVTYCPYTDCALHIFRFVKEKQNPAVREKAIRKYCLWCMNGQFGEVNKCPSVHCPLYLYRKGGLTGKQESLSFEESDSIGAYFSGIIPEAILLSLPSERRRKKPL